MAERAGCDPCVLTHTVRRPSPSIAAAVDRTSSGQAAIRWLPIEWLTTTSQSSNEISARASSFIATFVPAAGKSRISSFVESAVLITAGRGS